MANRNFYINGEVMVQVQGNGMLALSGVYGAEGQTHNLGLTSEAVRVSPAFNDMDVRTDDYGPAGTPETLIMPGEVSIRIPLIHFNKDVLNGCIGESMGGVPGQDGWAGITAPAGTPRGGGKALYLSGNHYIGLTLTSPVAGADPWKFPSAYMTGPPFEWPLGAERSIVMTNWRAIPYDFPLPLLVSSGTLRGVEITSSGQELWRRAG